MNILIRILGIVSTVTIASPLFAQGVYRYNPDQPSYEFKEGIYINVDMVKKDSPIPSTWIDTDLNVNDRDFFKNITRNDEILFYDDNGVRTVLDAKSIWGYGDDGNIYINVGGAFHKIDLFGRISHFIAIRTTYSPIEILEGHREIWYHQPMELTHKNEEYLFDILENKVWDFDLDGLERVLEKDQQLWNEFMSLKKRKKEKSKYVYLMRYNEKYPLDFPIN